MDKQEWGAHGEDIAKQFLTGKGYVHIESNFSSKWGEIDLVMEDRRDLVFVEVKFRRNDHYGEPEEAVTPRKMQHLSRAAFMFVVQKGFRNKMIRFDIVSIGPKGIRHYQNAYPLGDGFTY